MTMILIKNWMNYLILLMILINPINNNNNLKDLQFKLSNINNPNLLLKKIVDLTFLEHNLELLIRIQEVKIEFKKSILVDSMIIILQLVI